MLQQRKIKVKLSGLTMHYRVFVTEKQVHVYVKLDFLGQHAIHVGISSNFMIVQYFLVTCPVNANNEICNGHGKCINQEEASLTWDGVYLHTSGLVSDPLHAIEGCICDEPYSGYDCSLRQCPYGDDPRTTTVIII